MIFKDLLHHFLFPVSRNAKHVLCWKLWKPPLLKGSLGLLFIPGLLEFHTTAVWHWALRKFLQADFCPVALRNVLVLCSESSLSLVCWILGVPVGCMADFLNESPYHSHNFFGPVFLYLFFAFLSMRFLSFIVQTLYYVFKFACIVLISKNSFLSFNKFPFTVSCFMYKISLWGD